MSTERDATDAARPARKRSWRSEIALTVGAVAGLLCVLIALSAFLFGVTPLVFRSGSMAPAIETGALALSKTTPAVDVQVGDVVNVTNAAGNGITHRVVDLGAVGSDSVELFLKGDANAEPDAEPYVVAEVGRVVFSVPKLGYVVTWLSGPIAVFAGGVLVGVLLMIAWRPHGRTAPEQVSDEPPTGRHGKMPRSVLVVLAMIGAVGIASSNPPAAMAAPLTDTSLVTSGTVTTALPKPASFTCSGGGLLNPSTLSWPNNPAYSYRLDFTPVASGVTNPVILAPVAGATRTWDSTSIYTVLLLGTRTFTLRAFQGTNISPSAGTQAVTYVTGLITYCSGGTPAPAGANSRLAPQSAPTTTIPSTTTSSATNGPPTTTTEPTTITTTVPPTTTTTPPAEPAPPAAVEPPPTTTTPPTTTPPTTTPPTTTPPTTTTPPAPVDLISPQTSPSGSAVAKVVSVDGSPTLQITDSTGIVQYTAPISSSSDYGYGVAWASGDQLWILGPGQLVRLDGTGSGWSRSVVDPTAADEIPAEISARLK